MLMKNGVFIYSIFDKALEDAWIKELNQKYPVEVNWKVLKKLK